MGKKPPALPTYEYKIINCHSMRDSTGIQSNKELIKHVLSINDGWRFHTFIAADAFGFHDIPLIILERLTG